MNWIAAWIPTDQLYSGTPLNLHCQSNWWCQGTVSLISLVVSVTHGWDPSLICWILHQGASASLWLLNKCTAINFTMTKHYIQYTVWACTSGVCHFRTGWEFFLEKMLINKMSLMSHLKSISLLSMWPLIINTGCKLIELLKFNIQVSKQLFMFQNATKSTWSSK